MAFFVAYQMLALAFLEVIVRFGRLHFIKTLNLHRRNANKVTQSTSESCQRDDVSIEAAANTGEIVFISFS